MSEHYVPILKGRMGEFRALELAPELRDHMTPLVDIPRVPVADRHKPLDHHLDKTVTGIAKGWGVRREILVDLFDIDLAERTTTGDHPVTYVFRELHSRKIDAVPVIGFDRDGAYEDAVRDAAARVGGVVIRLLPDDLASPTTLANSIDSMLASVAIERPRARLILDLRSLRDMDVSHYVAVVLRALRALPHADAYASVVVSGSSVPQSLGEDVAASSMGRIPRKELELWRRIRLTPGLPCRATFGDYGVVHPDNLDIDPKKLTLAADIRYTAQQDMLVVKGKSFKSHPLGYKQYHDLAKLLISLPDYRGHSFSWGDRRVADCARQRCGPGGKTTWVTVATSHHLAVVVEQLAAA